MPSGIYIRTEYHKNQISKSLKNHIVLLKTRRKIGLANSIHRKGKKLSKKHKKNISISNLGKKHSEKTKEKMRINSYWWKGDRVGYGGLHMYVKKYLGRPNICVHCGIKEDNQYKIHWANKSGKYKRDLNDWIRLCIKCHRIYDKQCFAKK